MNNIIPQRVLAQQLIEQAKVEQQLGITDELHITAMLTLMSESLETIITMILQEHDYHANRTSLTNCACDVLARYAANFDRYSPYKD